MTRFSGSLQAEESFRRWEAERKQKRNSYWAMLRKANADYLKLTNQAGIKNEIGMSGFYYYLQQTYGLKVELIDGRSGGEHAIVDEKKHLLFLLKYG